MGVVMYALGFGALFTGAVASVHLLWTGLRDGTWFIALLGAAFTVVSSALALTAACRVLIMIIIEALPR